MATRFELVLHGANAASLRAAGEEVFEEIERLENRLSLYRAGSEISHLNREAARGPVVVSPGLFDLLDHARRLTVESAGAFDITVAPLVRCWGFMGGDGAMPGPAEVAEARSRVGMGHIHLDQENRTVRFGREGVMIDLGAIGKGYAIERAVGLLREAGVERALIHGGTSTVYGLGAPPDQTAWSIAIEIPPQDPDLPYARLCWNSGTPHPPQHGTAHGTARPEPPRIVTLPLRDESLSVSAAWGKFFHAGGRKFGHVLDPRSGEPVSRAALALVALPSATETDALSTALLVEGRDGHDRIAGLRPGMRTLVAVEVGDGFQLDYRGPAGGAGGI